MAGVRLIADTGPLVAFFNRGDQFHPWASDQFDSISQPLITTDRHFRIYRRHGRQLIPLRAPF